MTTRDELTPPLPPRGTVVEGFDDVIMPMSRDEFLDAHWSRSFALLPGTRGRFASLLQWDELAGIIEQHRFKPPRLRLAQNGKPVEQNRYLSHYQDGSGSFVRAAGLLNCLTAGASLVLDQIDEAAPRIRALAADFERVLRSYTSVNLYAGWRTQNAFDLHWDPQETTILQVDGRKHWKVYRPTLLHPLDKHLKKVPLPTDDPVWEGILESGDALYMPRGWWHVAYPLDEPSLHLTFTTVPPNGAGLLEWLVSELRQNPLVRSNLPQLAGRTQQVAYMEALRSALLDTCTEDAMSRYLNFVDSQSLTRPSVRFPHQTPTPTSSIGSGSRIKLALGKRVWLEPSDKDGESKVRLHDLEWRCPTAITPALEPLNDQTFCSVADLCELLDDPQHAFRLKIFIATLSLAGAVWVE